MMLRYKNKQYVLTTPILEVNKETTNPKDMFNYDQDVDDATKVSCILIATMTPKLQKTYEDY